MSGGQRYEVRRWVCGARHAVTPKYFSPEKAREYAELEARRRDINVTAVELFDLAAGKAIATWVYGLEARS